jgi:hypothetical protein
MTTIILSLFIINSFRHSKFSIQHQPRRHYRLQGVDQIMLTIQSLVVSICTASINTKKIYIFPPKQSVYTLHVVLTSSYKYFVTKYSQTCLCNGSTLCSL